MSCQTRIDAPGAQHHVIVSNIEHGKMFRGNIDLHMRRADRSEGRARYIGQEENHNLMGIPQKALTLYILWVF